MYFAATGLLGMVVGRAVDRFGSKPLLILGSIIFGIGFFLLSRITQLLAIICGLLAPVFWNELCFYANH